MSDEEREALEAEFPEEAEDDRLPWRETNA
jgi:hypothetical protein